MIVSGYIIIKKCKLLVYIWKTTNDKYCIMNFTALQQSIIFFTILIPLLPKMYEKIFLKMSLDLFLIFGKKGYKARGSTNMVPRDGFLGVKHTAGDAALGHPRPFFSPPGHLTVVPAPSCPPGCPPQKSSEREMRPSVAQTGSGFLIHSRLFWLGHHANTPLSVTPSYPNHSLWSLSGVGDGWFSHVLSLASLFKSAGGIMSLNG